MFESGGIRLVRESVGDKSAKLYRPCLTLTSIQSKVNPYKGYISQKITNRWHCRAKQRFIELFRKKNKLGEGSYRNDHEGINSSLRQMFYGIYKPSDMMNISLTSSYVLVTQLLFYRTAGKS